MSEAIVHPVLAATTVTEQTHDLTDQMREFYDRNHTAISVAVVLGVSMFLNRAIIRRELTRLKFVVEVVQDGDLVDLSQYDYLGDD